jgi:hypothetical protein
MRLSALSALSVNERTVRCRRSAYPPLFDCSTQEDIMGFDLGNLLQQYLGGGANANQAQAADDFDRVAQQAPREDVARGVTQALRSDQTPPFPQMVGQLFGHSDPNQRAGMLNQLISSLGPQCCPAWPAAPSAICWAAARTA